MVLGDRRIALILDDCDKARSLAKDKRTAPHFVSIGIGECGIQGPWSRCVVTLFTHVFTLPFLRPCHPATHLWHTLGAGGPLPATHPRWKCSKMAAIAFDIWLLRIRDIGPR